MLLLESFWRKTTYWYFEDGLHRPPEPQRNLACVRVLGSHPQCDRRRGGPGRSDLPTASAPAVTINNAPAIVFGAALAPGAVGLYQIAIHVPNTLADGDWPIQANIGGVQSPAGTLLSVQD
jgi:hypothetical protein